MRRLVTLLAIVTALNVALNAAAQRRRAVDPQPIDREKRILFIGNSLTYTNDLPSIVCRLAVAGGKQAVCESVTEGGYALEDHFHDGIAAQRLRNEQWSIVVLQQGPSALEESRINLREWTAKFAELIRAAGGQPALYAVWPEKARSFDFPRVSQSYRLAASDVGALFFPAGDAWLAAWHRDPSLALYSADDFHPSITGSYLAALVIYRVIWNELPPRSVGLQLGLDHGRLAMLDAAVDEVTTRAPPAGGPGPQR